MITTVNYSIRVPLEAAEQFENLVAIRRAKAKRAHAEMPSKTSIWVEAIVALAKREKP